MMKKILITIFLFLIFFGLSTTKVNAEVCPGINHTINPPQGQIHPDSGHITVTVTTSSDCFLTNADYTFAYWKADKPIDTAWGEWRKPLDARTFIADWDLIGDRRALGTWNFRLYYGRGWLNKPPETVMLDFQYEITYPGGNPSIRPEQSTYQVGNKATFIVENAQVGEYYTFWWDGDKTPRLVTEATSSTFKITPEPAIMNVETNKKFCMEVGSHRTAPSCRFSTTVTFTAGPVITGVPTGPCPGLTEPALTKCIDCVEGRDPATQGKPGAWTALGCISTDPSGFISWLLQKVIGIAGGIAFLLILFGGFQILTSAGNPEKLASGKEIVVSAIAGLLMIIFSVLLLRIIGYDILQIPGFITNVTK